MESWWSIGSFYNTTNQAYQYCSISMDTSICSTAGILEMLSNITITNFYGRSLEACFFRSCQAVFVVLTDSVTATAWLQQTSSRLDPASSKGLYLSSPYQPCRITLPPQTNQRRSKINQRRSNQWERVPPKWGNWDKLRLRGNKVLCSYHFFISQRKIGHSA